MGVDAVHTRLYIRNGTWAGALVTSHQEVKVHSCDNLDNHVLVDPGSRQWFKILTRLKHYEAIIVQCVGCSIFSASSVGRPHKSSHQLPVQVVYIYIYSPPS